MSLMIKARFENSQKNFEICFTMDNKKKFEDQQKLVLENLDYENIETRMLHHLYNSDSKMFVFSTSEIKASNLIIYSKSRKKITFLKIVL
jgi:hypothetical protein